jgi:hypothetical protein
MKKLLLSALIAAASLTVGEAKAAEYKTVTVMTGATYGWLGCDWEYTSVDDVQDFINQGGWQVVSQSPMNFSKTSWLSNQQVYCSGLSVTLSR